MKLRSLIKGILTEVFTLDEFCLDEQNLEEERITNKDAAERVRNKENFVGSHTFGEDLGDLGLMYVAYSYGAEHPLYIYDSKENRWYHNNEDYIKDDGQINTWTRKHLEDLRPNSKTQGRPNSFMVKKVRDFMVKHKIPDTTHTDVPPGEK